jgi:8-oxo-dGTP pyrophosphatase MutT (NUDIX family)
MHNGLNALKKRIDIVLQLDVKEGWMFGASGFMSKPPKTTVRVAVAALIRDADRYLFIRQNKPGGAYPGTLHLPGGSIDIAEDPDDAIRREAKEETGLEVMNLTRFDFDHDIIKYKGKITQFIFLRYLAECDADTSRAGSDAVELLWLYPFEIALHSHNPPSYRLLAKLKLL